VHGYINATIKLGGRDEQHKVVVADVFNDGIIGLRFLKKQRLVLEFASGKLMGEDGEELTTVCRAGTERVCRVTMNENITIRAGTRTVVQGRAAKALAAGTWLIEPLAQPGRERPVLTARTLARGDGVKVPVEIMNPTDEDVLLYRRTSMGILSRLPSPEIVGSIAARAHLTEIKLPDAAVKEREVPPELQTLIEGIEEDIPEEQRRVLTNLLLEKEDTFKLKGQPLGRTDLVQHEVDTGDARPIKQPVRRPPIHWRETAEIELQKMLDSDVIEPSNSPWASPVVLVKKKDGTARYCIDYRRLNAVTRKDSYPLPRIDDSLDALGKAKYFSTLDLASGYWQIGMGEDARAKSAFCSTSGLFQFKVMPFGMTNAPATFQRLMERVLAGLQWRICLVYIDDIIIFSETVDEHLQQLSSVLQRLQLAGLKLKPQKCFLLRKKVSYLGHIVSSQGIEPDPKKISAVQDWKTPATVTEVRSFLGFCSYYRRFMPDFATISKPLILLTRNW